MMPTAGSIESSFSIAAGADHVAGDADVLRVDRCYVAGARRSDFAHAGGVGQQFELVERLRIAALRRHHLLELLVRRPIHQVLLGHQARLFQRGRLLAEEDHARGQFQRELGQVGGPRILQGLRRFHDLERVADGVAQRLVHVGDQRLHLLIHAAADPDHGLRQAAGVHLRLHESAGAHFDIQHQRIDALGELLRHDRRRNQRDRFHRRRHITQRVQLAVRRHQPLGLPDEAQAEFGELLLEFLRAEIGAEARNRFQFIQRAAGMPERAARHHRHHDSRGRGQRRHDEAGLVAHAAGGMFVHFDARNARKIDGVAGMQHALRQAADLAVSHPREVDGHQERRHLVVGNLTVGVSVYQELDLFRR